ncbi:CAP domain-containing protein, partial [candidate division KSB1 bacterium]|nr:CAP domain-containing protein [candidate division KSB1 bacterium]
NSLLWFNLNINVAFQPRLFIKLPDGSVQENGLIKNNSLKKYMPGSTIQYLNQPGEYLFNYTPQQEGTYLFEIIDSYGSAILIVPYYCGNSIPLIPSDEQEITAEKFDLISERKKMLLEINQIRNSLQLIPLIMDSTLNRLGMYYVNRMATENFYGHVAPDKEDLLRRKKKFSILPTIRENIAVAPAIRIAKQNLINSPAHYAAMIDSTMRKVGFGLALSKNETFLLVQYFAAAPLIDFELDQLLDNIFHRMKSQRNDLVRIFQPDRLPFLKNYTIKVTDVEQLQITLLNGIAAESWLQPNVKKVYFESLSQQIEGLVLTIKFYP